MPYTSHSVTQEKQKDIFFPHFFCCSSTVDSIFLPSVHPTQLLELTPLIPPHLVLSMCPLYMFLRSLTPFPPLSPPNLPSGCSQFLLFFSFNFFSKSDPLAGFRFIFNLTYWFFQKLSFDNIAS